MKTLILSAGHDRPIEAALAPFGGILRRGELVAFPTETVYGIAAARDDPEAIERLRALKGRDADKPLTVHIASLDALVSQALPLAPAVARIVRRLWPGPLTIVIPDLDGGFTGFRLPADEWARALIRSAKVPVVATSANRSGGAPLIDGEHVLREYDGRLHGIITSGKTRHGAPSTVIRAEGSSITILRPGALPASTIRQAGLHTVLFVCTGNICRSPMAMGLARAGIAKRLGAGPGELASYGIRIISAGTADLLGTLATPAAVRAAAELGASISSHRSQPVTPSLIEWADEVVVAERRHAQVIEQYVPDAVGKVRLILPDGTDLPDPIGMSDDHYRRTARRIEKALQPMVERLAGQVEAERTGG